MLGNGSCHLLHLSVPGGIASEIASEARNTVAVGDGRGCALVFPPRCDGRFQASLVVQLDFAREIVVLEDIS